MKFSTARASSSSSSGSSTFLAHSVGQISRNEPFPSGMAPTQMSCQPRFKSQASKVSEDDLKYSSQLVMPLACALKGLHCAKGLVLVASMRRFKVELDSVASATVKLNRINMKALDSIISKKL